MSKRRLLIALLLGSPVLSLASYASWHSYQTPRVELSSELWPETSSLAPNDMQQLSFLTTKRHADFMQLSQQFTLQANGHEFSIHITSVSYPSLYPSSIRVGFELNDPSEHARLLQQKRFVLRQPD